MADFGITEVDAAVQETVANMVQSFLIQEAVLMERVMNIPSQKGEDTVKIPNSQDSFVASTKAENTALSTQTITYSTDDLALSLHKAIQVRIEDKANVSVMFDLLQDLLPRMTKTLALDIDTQIVGQLELASAAAPDHSIPYDNATSLGKTDLLNARVLLHTQNIPFNECYIGVSAQAEVDLLAIDDFVHVDKYGSSEGLVNGELGRLYGARVIWSNEFDDLKTIVWHPSCCAFSRQVQPKFEVDRDLPNLADVYSLSHLYGVKVLDGGRRQVVLGTA